MERLEVAEGARRRKTTGGVRARDLERERATAASRMEGRRVALRRGGEEGAGGGGGGGEGVEGAGGVGGGGGWGGGGGEYGLRRRSASEREEGWPSGGGPVMQMDRVGAEDVGAEDVGAESSSEKEGGGAGGRGMRPKSSPSQSPAAMPQQS